MITSERVCVPRPSAMLARLGSIALAWVVVVVVASLVGQLWLWLLVWPALSVLALCPAAVMHEGLHANLTGDRRVDRVLAFLGGWFIFVPTAAYRPYHLQHHIATISDDDPSGAAALPFRSRAHYLFIMTLSGAGFLAQMWGIAVRTLVGKPPGYMSSGHRRQLRVETALGVMGYAAVAVVVTLTGTWPVLVAVWVAPVALGLAVVAPVVLTSEHYGAELDTPLLDNTATVDSNWVLRYVYLNNNHHTAHHLAPTANPLALPKITAAARGRIRLHHRSYTAFHRQVWKDLGATKAASVSASVDP